MGTVLQFANGEVDSGIGHGSIPVLLDQRPDACADLCSSAAAYQVIDRRVDTAPDARDAGLVGGVIVSGPLQGDGNGRPVFKAQDVVAVSAEAAWEIRRSGQGGKDLRRGTAEGAMAGKVAREG